MGIGSHLPATRVSWFLFSVGLPSINYLLCCKCKVLCKWLLILQDVQHVVVAVLPLLPIGKWGYREIN